MMAHSLQHAPAVCAPQHPAFWSRRRSFAFVFALGALWWGLVLVALLRV